MLFRVIKLSVSGIFWAILGLTSLRANIIVNGDFELVGANPGTPASTFTTDYAALSSNTLTGWTSTAGNGVTPANYLSTAGSTADWIPDPFSGNYSVQFDSSTDANIYTIGGELSQIVSLSQNVSYQLTFRMSAEAARGQATTSSLAVTLNGAGFSNFTTTFSTSRPGNDTKASPDWVLETLSFTPTLSGPVTLTFQDIFVTNATSSNSSLDDVILIPIIPEFSDWRIYAFFLSFPLIIARRRGLGICAHARAFRGGGIWKFLCTTPSLWSNYGSANAVDTASGSDTKSASAL